MVRVRKFVGVVIASAALGSQAWGQANSEYNRVVQSQKAAASPTIDGNLDDPIWQQTERQKDFYDRLNGGLIADQTEFAISYDEKFIYVAFWIFDSQPNLIVARETIENSRFSGNDEAEDYVDVRFDPYRTGSNQDTTTFSINALGTRSVRFGAGRANKKEWRGDWVAAAQRNEKGWTGEIAIPWEMLNYPGNASGIDMGLNVFRYQRRTNLQSCWSNVGPEFYSERQGFWRGVQPPKPPSPKISFLPYVLFGVDEKDTRVDVGLDARYPITSELTAVATLNPDFGTVEGAVESIGFTRTERFVGERRPFFLEGSEYYNLGRDFEFAQMFYGRRIPIVDFGAKIFGKMSPNDSVGALYTMGDGDQHDGVMKFEHRYNQLGSIQLFGGFRQHQEDENQVLSGKISERFDRVTATLYGAASSGNGESGTGYQATLWWDQKPHFLYFAYKDISSDFRVANGFVRNTGIRGPGLFYEFEEEPKTGPWQDYGLEIDLGSLDNTDGSRYEDSASIGLRGRLRKTDTRFWGGYTTAKFGDENDEIFSINAAQGSSRFKTYGLSYQTGMLSDDDFDAVSPFFSFRLGKAFDISYQGTWFKFGGTTEQHIMTLNYELSPTRSIGGRVVMQDDDWNGYLSYRHSGKKGLETFIILGDPNARKTQKVLQLKLVAPF